MTQRLLHEEMEAIPRHTRSLFEMEVRGSRYHDKIWLPVQAALDIWKRMRGEFSSHCFAPGGVLLYQSQLLHSQRL